MRGRPALDDQEFSGNEREDFDEVEQMNVIVEGNHIDTDDVEDGSDMDSHVNEGPGPGPGGDSDPAWETSSEPNGKGELESDAELEPTPPPSPEEAPDVRPNVSADIEPLGVPAEGPDDGPRRVLLNASGLPREEWGEVCKVFTEDGATELGIIKYSQKFQKMSAWCCWRDPSDDPSLFSGFWGSHGTCRCDRSVIDTGPGKRGRPLAYLVAWLRRAEMHMDQKSHNRGQKDITKAERLECRLWISAMPEFDEALSLERALHAGEPLEHDKNP